MYTLKTLYNTPLLILAVVSMSGRNDGTLLKHPLYAAIKFSSKIMQFESVLIEYEYLL